MIDEAYDGTEEIIKKLEKKIQEVYTQAKEETEKKMQKHLKDFARKDKEKLKALHNKEITQQQYNDWRIGQIAIGQRWEEMRDTLAQDLLNTKKIAENMTRSYSADVFALNHNYATFLVEKDSLVDTSYTLYNHDAVIRLIRDNPNMLPRRKNSDQKLKRWYNQKIQSAILQGILQGEGAYKIAERMGDLYAMDAKATIRTARTALTGAQNAGRHQANMRAEHMGINRVEIWRAIMDGRTRHAHRQLDGQVKDVNGYFHSELGDIRFPGDPQAAPANVYNCRCALITRRAGQQFQDRYREQLLQRRNPALGDMTYEEWKDAPDKKLRKLAKEDEERSKRKKKDGE